MDRSPTTRPAEAELDSLSALVDDYVRRVRPDAIEDLSFYANQFSLAETLVLVGDWKDKDGRCPVHQKFLPARVKAAAGERIRALDIGAARHFNDVFEAVEREVGVLEGVGPRTVYDIALRLGAVLGLPPTRVFLHASALRGARALGLVPRERSLALDAFPGELRRLGAWEIENFLGLYADDLARLKRTRDAA